MKTIAEIRHLYDHLLEKATEEVINKARPEFEEMVGDCYSKIYEDGRRLYFKVLKPSEIYLDCGDEPACVFKCLQLSIESDEMKVHIIKKNIYFLEECEKISKDSFHRAFVAFCETITDMLVCSIDAEKYLETYFE